jgi:hypothetical protein
MLNISIPFEEGFADWQNLGKKLSDNKVREVYFVHGTFVGKDPLGFFNLLSKVVPEMSLIQKGIDVFEKIAGENIPDLILGDVGNYTEEYVADFSANIGHGLSSPANRFIWSSGNYHRARLDATLELAVVLAETIAKQGIKADERILLIGHSHAGQVFALLTQFLANTLMSNALLNHLRINPHKSITLEQLDSALQNIRTPNLDIVTFGTPVRYTWGKYPKFRLLPVINHRHDSELDGVQTIRDGDYVQQWGVEGTDTSPQTNLIEENELSAIIQDRGNDIKAFLASYKDHSRRFPKHADGTPVTENVYVDYKDNKETLNPLYCVENVFGHGVYTTKKAMLFNTQLIVEKFYS